MVLAAIVVAAAALRFYRIDVTWFFLDHVRDVSAAAAVASGESFPLLGPRIGSTGAYLGPLYFYLLAIPFSIAHDPVAAVVFVALGHIVALLALYRFAAEFFGPRVALYAAAFFAAFPLVVLSSRLVWTAGLLPLFIVLYMHALFRLIVGERSAAAVPLLALLAVLTQLHLTSIALAGVALAAVLLVRPRLRLAHAFWGASLFTLLYLPYFVHELAHGFENSIALFRSGVADQGLTRFEALPSVAGNLLLLFSPVLRGFVVEAEWSGAFLTGFRVLYGAQALAFAIGLALCAYRVLPSAPSATHGVAVERRQAALLLLWIGFPLLVVESKETPIWWYYLDVVHPAPFIVAGIALSSLPSLLFRASSARRWAAPTLAWLAAAIVVAQASLLVGFQRRAAERGEMIVQVPRVCINAAGSPFETLVTLPLSHRREIVRTLIGELGVEERAFFTKVHGAVLGLAEENRYLVSHLWASHSRRPRTPAASDVHFLVTRAAEEIPENEASRSKRIGPYTVLERRPMIDVESWSCAVTSRAAAEDTEWTRIALPASDAGLTLHERERLFCRGTIHAPPGAANVRIAVSLVGWAPFDAVALRAGDRLLAPVARQRRQNPLMLKAASGWEMGIGWASETVFALSGAPPSGKGTVTIEIAGVGDLIGLDVYEGRSW
jgi:4-amino-4-deoxy-L-arabinose transferase-like glycosyltransferase